MSAATPDLDGFRAAMAQHRETFGLEVIFKVPNDDEVWPADASIDPETQRPFDPTIEPDSGGGETDIPLKVNCYMGLRVPGPDDSDQNALGIFEDGTGTLDLSPAQADTVQAATAVLVYGERHNIEEREAAGIGNAVHRVLLYIRQA